jgi:hypothetical protein
LEPNAACILSFHQPQGSGAMREYRAYIVGIIGNHRFVRVKEFLSDYPDDAAALNAAKQLTNKHDVEVWDCGRLVARLSPDGEVTSPELAPSLVIAAQSCSDEKSILQESS